MYIGGIIWNRQRFIKDPETGKRQARPNAPAEWIVQEVPELRIVDDELWNAAKTRQTAIKLKREEDGTQVQNSFRDRRRPKYLFSGLIKCACCRGGYAMISTDLIGCSTARNKGTCDNRSSIPRERLETRVLNALRYHLMNPALFKEFCNEFTREMNRLRMEGSASIEAARSEIKRIERELDTPLNLILKGGAADKINAKMVQLESRKAELEQVLRWLTQRSRRPFCIPRWQPSIATRSAPCTRHCRLTPRRLGRLARFCVRWLRRFFSRPGTEN